jgi:glutathione S-transferase
MLKLYHAEPVANSLKVLIPLHEKGLPFESHYVDLHKFEQHEPWFVGINPEGQVPVLDHDGLIITQSSVINEYLEDAFPDPPLRPSNIHARAQMRIWNKFIDEHVMNYVSMHGWHHMVRRVAQAIDKEELERLLERIPLKEQRDKWRTVAGTSFSGAELAEAERKISVAVDRFEKQLTLTSFLVGEMFTLADVNAYSHCGMMVARMFPHIANPDKTPKLLEWVERVTRRPGVQAALAMPDHTNPELRTFTGRT